jgi:hypothetical protein
LIDSEKSGFGLFKMSKRTNLDIKDAACLHIVHILQHPSSRPTKSMQTTIVNALEKELFTDSGGQIQQIDKAFTPTTSLSE